MEQQPSSQQPSRLIAVLREGIGVVQMILYKEVKKQLARDNPDKEQTHLAMLAGAITNTVFGSSNPEKKFQDFYRSNRGTIEQERKGDAGRPLEEGFDLVGRAVPLVDAEDLEIAVLEALPDFSLDMGGLAPALGTVVAEEKEEDRLVLEIAQGDHVVIQVAQ